LTTSAALNAGNFDAFRKALREHGYVEGQNLVIEYLSADGRPERFPALAADLVRLKVDLIVTRGTPAAQAAKNATATIPVVMAAIGAVLLFIAAVIVIFTARGGGSIVNIASVLGFGVDKGVVAYATAKAGVIQLTKALALEVATRGITVNAVAPGIIATPMTAALFDAAAIERLVPLNRAGLPEEVAAVVAFLASEEASYVTAQIISVSGGMA